MLKIIQFENQFKIKWDDYVKKSHDGTFFHLNGWKDMIEKTFKFRSLSLMALSNTGEINGVLPLFLMKDILRNKYLVSNPFSPYAGVCADNEEAKSQLLSRAKELAVENGVQYLELRQFAREEYTLPTKTDFISMIMKIEKEEEIIWKKSLLSVTRNRVRKAYKEGLTVDFGSRYLDDFYKALSINIRDLGSPNYPKTFLKNILEEFSDSSGLIVVKHRNVVIGGMLFVSFNNTISDLWVSSVRKYHRLCPNEILYWEAIKYACGKGYEHFDFGRSPIDSGTIQFKKKWGAKPVQLYYQYYLNKMKTIPRVSAHNNKYQTAINLWKKLPLSVASMIGPRLIKYLPEL